MIAAIIVAAGRSSRMGVSKALLPHVEPRTTFVRYLINTMHQGGASPVLVVTRPADDELDREVSAAGGELVRNLQADAGQLSSLLAGLTRASADPRLTGVLLCPVDVPLVNSSTVMRLIALADQSTAVILRATHGGIHGHPVLFKREVFDELRATDSAAGARAVVRADPARVLDVEVDDPGVTIDVDTPADYERLFGRPAAVRR